MNKHLTMIMQTPKKKMKITVLLIVNFLGILG